MRPGERHTPALCGAQCAISKFLQTLFDPYFAVERSFAEQEGASDSPRGAVRSTRQGHIEDDPVDALALAGPLRDAQAVHQHLPHVIVRCVDRRVVPLGGVGRVMEA